MKGLFGLMGLLLSLAIVGVLVKKQLASTPQIVPALQLPVSANSDDASTTPAVAAGTVKEQAQQIQQQVKQALEAAMQKPRAEPDEK